MTYEKEIKINKREIKLTNLDKVFYPKSNYTKGDIIQYYEKIADYMLPHVKNRLLVMHRYPEGINNEDFYQKQIPDYFPSWIEHKTINLKKGEKQTLVVIRKKEDIVYLANQGTLVFHVWLSPKNNINKPDKIIFDLDP